jgi:hypothetical protein
VRPAHSNATCKKPPSLFLLILTLTTTSPALHSDNRHNRHEHKQKHINTKKSLIILILTAPLQPFYTSQTLYSITRLIARALTNLTKTLPAKLLRLATSSIPPLIYSTLDFINCKSKSCSSHLRCLAMRCTHLTLDFNSLSVLPLPAPGHSPCTLLSPTS